MERVLFSWKRHAAPAKLNEQHPLSLWLWYRCERIKKGSWYTALFCLFFLPPWTGFDFLGTLLSCLFSLLGLFYFFGLELLL